MVVPVVVLRWGQWWSSRARHRTGPHSSRAECMRASALRNGAHLPVLPDRAGPSAHGDSRLVARVFACPHSARPSGAPATLRRVAFMLLSTVGPTWKGFARPLAYVAVAIVAAIFLLSLTSFTVSAHGRTSAARSGGGAHRGSHTPEEAATKRAVIVVGPVGSETNDFIRDAT